MVSSTLGPGCSPVGMADKTVLHGTPTRGHGEPTLWSGTPTGGHGEPTLWSGTPTGGSSKFALWSGGSTGGHGEPRAEFATSGSERDVLEAGPKTPTAECGQTGGTSSARTVGNLESDVETERMAAAI
jgi:hypothetical protein